MYRKPKVIWQAKSNQKSDTYIEAQCGDAFRDTQSKYQGCQSSNKYMGGGEGGGVGGNEACLMILPDPKNCQISCTLLTFIPHELRFSPFSLVYVHMVRIA